MKKIYFLSLALLMALAVSAQVTVTFKVDVTEYVATTAIDANGMRIGGDFATVGGTLADDTAMPDWSPSDAACAMTDEGNNIWSITVKYPESAIGTTQQFKFVNGDWGTNEGGDGSMIATDGCGTDDGNGNINRTFDVPSNNVVLTYCYDKCKTCGGDDPILAISTPQSVSNFAVYPNPTSGNTKFAYTLEQTEQVTLNVYNMLGAVVATVYGGTQPAGTYTLEVSLANLDHGMYIYKMQVGDSSTQGQIVKQ